MSRTALLFGLAMSLAGGFAAAQDAAPAPAESAIAQGAAPAETSPLIAGADALGESLTPDDLIGRRGGESTTNVTNLQNLTASTSNNKIQADSLDTGDVTFDSGALNGFSGVGNFVVNTGANSNVLGSLSVTIVNAAP